jgi:hypothetical protein
VTFGLQDRHQIGSLVFALWIAPRRRLDSGGRSRHTGLTPPGVAISAGDRGHHFATTTVNIVWLAAVTVTATTVAIATLVFLHGAPTGLSPIRNAVSEYGISEVRVGYRIMAVSMGLAGLAAAAGVGTSFRNSAGVAAPVVLLAVFGLSRLMISWFPMDAPDAPRTPTGVRHGVLALVTFASITAASFELRRLVVRMNSTAALPATGYAAVLLWLSWALLTAVILTLLTRGVPQLRGYFGAAERLIYLGTFALLLAIGIQLIG